MCHDKEPPILTLSKNLRWSELRCITYRSDLYNLKTRRKLKKYLTGTIKLSLNENMLKILK